MSYNEYQTLTLGEIEDLAMCKAIQSGAMDEVPVYDGSFIPELR